ncbi:PIN domain-containing protein [Candidatus Roizmanbacteria bacterium]|nr:PIN domain-containing protein [Candidatus Roizmanbacteria bacterium]
MKSYFIDTNYFLRLLLKDDKKQFDTVYILFQQAVNQEIKIITSIIVFFEIYWVLSSFYKKNKLKIVKYLEKIIKMEFLEIENRQVLQETLILFENHTLDLEDCYNIAYAKGFSADEFSTFDKKINRLLKTNS